MGSFDLQYKKRAKAFNDNNINFREEENGTLPEPKTTSSTTTSTSTSTSTTTPRTTTSTTTTTTTPRSTSTTSTTTPRPYQPSRRYPYYPRTTPRQPPRSRYYPRITSTTEIPHETNPDDMPPNPEDNPDSYLNPSYNTNNTRPIYPYKPTNRPIERNPDERPENRLPSRRPYKPYPDTTETTTPNVRRPNARPHFYPRRPTTLTEVTVSAPTDVYTIERDRSPDGTYDISAGDIPKDKWTNVVGRDPVDPEFDPILVNCLNGFERNDRGECVGKFDIMIKFINN